MENEADNKENEQLVSHEAGLSIQEAFKRFQKEKFYQLKLNRYLKHIELDRTSPQFKSQLRQRFLQTAQQYVGVPYARKFHAADEPLYSAPLFLDCCGLVRQCVFDLRGEFGYTLGKWNQSYQFDLLPEEGKGEADLQPGDLIFYSATYNNPKLKPFPHRLVHVEIYLGEGRSIGARWQKGTIQVFPSYKFDSSLYHSVQHHYRSIDCWLQGTFKSHCQEHKWTDERTDWLSDKFSVFADPALEEGLENVQPAEVRRVMVGKGNNSRLVREYFQQREGYVLMSDKETFSPQYFLKWVQSTGEVDFHSFKAGQQIVNHIANISVVSSKLELLKTLKDYCPSVDFLPQTYRLDVMSDEMAFLNDHSEGVWIYKPRNLNQGRGIRMIADIAQFKAEFIASKKFHLGQYCLNSMLQQQPEPSQLPTSSKYSELKHDGLIQHYIRPLLLNNKKFDMRCYLFIHSQPAIALFHPGYLRLTIEDYTEESIEDESQLMVHLTNNCFQNKHPSYKANKEDTIADWDRLQLQYGQPAVAQLLHQIKRMLLLVYQAAKLKLVAKQGTYELLGCDVIVDRHMKPYLLEVNTNPAMFTDTQVQKLMLPKLMNNTLDVVLDLHHSHSAKAVAATAAQRGFDLLSCEETGFAYE